MKPKLMKQVLALRRAKSYRRAYNDAEFLSRPENRPIRLQLELLKPETVLAEHGVKTTVVVFGSARTMPLEESKARVEKLASALRRDRGNKDLKSRLAVARRLLRSAKYYEEARRFSALVARNGNIGSAHFITVTGGGPGIMEAANRGAWESGAKSIGLNITLPCEQGPNPYVSPEFCFRFHYFAIRKMHFVMRARALVAFPGGFGTMDELFEVLTLVQTGKKRHLPIVLMGRGYWKDIINFRNMAKWGYISYEDLDLFHFADTAEEAWEIIEKFYRENPQELE
ncbi:MAG TPA: TIGR00730 family Rossman fold protein [Elusimicrobiales bacterium]|nr:TIGR00730 family Rossman fold protein [Elusimicrobiales bacterium]